jgi:hypothetical protein
MGNNMKKIFILLNIVGLILIGALLSLRADIFRGKAGAMFEKNGVKNSIINAQGGVPDAVVFTSPAPGMVFNVNSFTVKGTASGKVDSVSVCIGAGVWQTASGTASWQYTFSGLANGNYTIKAHAVNSKGTGPDASLAVTIGVSPKVTIITGPTNSKITNQAFNVTLSVNRNFGYWSTNGSAFYQFPAGTTNLSIVSTTTLRYFGRDAALNTSATQKLVYILTPRITIIAGPTNNVTTNQAFGVTLSVDRNFGYWSTNGSVFNQFPTGTASLTVVTTTTMKYFGMDAGLNSSATQKRIYMFDTTAPVVTAQRSGTNISLSVNENWGYWSTNGGVNYSSFSQGTINIPIHKTTTYKYYGQDKWGNTSIITQSNTFIITNYYGIYSETYPELHYDTVRAFSDPLAAIMGTWGGAAMSANTVDFSDGAKSVQTVISAAGGVYIKYGTFTNAALWNGGFDTPSWTNHNLAAYSNGSVEFDFKSNSKDFFIKLEYGNGSPIIEKKAFLNLLGGIPADSSWHHVSIPITPANGFTSAALKKVSVSFGWYANAALPVTVLMDNIYWKFP